MTTSPPCTVASPPPRRPLWRTAAATAALLVVGPLAGAFAAPVVDGGSPTTPVYTEQGAPVAIGSAVTITGGTSYAGEYVEFAVDAAAGSDVLSLLSVATPVVTAGTVSIVGSSVYLGNGSAADPVGSVDATRDGQSGRPLRVNFTSAFNNPSFESADLTGWTPLNQRIDLGVTPINGIVPTDTSTYPTNTGLRQDDYAPTRPGSYTSTIQTGASAGSYALQLTSSGMTTAQGCDVVHGPGVYTAPFEAAAGDKIYFDWRAFAGQDNFHVFGYIVDENGVQTEVLDRTGPGTTPWAAQETIIPTAGEYRFVFIAGTHDATCGLAAGASLQIDNVRVYGAKATDDIAQQVARMLLYSNTSDTPPATRTVTITASSAADGSGSGQVAVAITPVDDGPTFVPPGTDTFTNSEGAQTYTDATGTFSASDPEGDAITYGIDGGTAQAATVGGASYTHAKVGSYGTLRVDSATGAHVFEPNAPTIDARLLDDAEAFTVTAVSLGITGTATYTVAVDVPATAPGTPTSLGGTAGPEQVTLTWTAPAWLGGSPLTSYLVESSTDGVLWTTVTETGTPETSYTVTGLTNGVETHFRVSATNGTGTGTPSTQVTSTPVDVAAAPTDLVALPGNEQAALSWTAPTDTGGTPVTGYRIESTTDGLAWATVVADTGSTGTTYGVTGLANGTAVTFRVSALNAVGAGPAGTEATTTPRTTPDAPTGLALTAGDEVVVLTWDAPLDDGGAPVTGYRIEQSSDGTTWTTVTADTGTTARTATVTPLVNGVPVHFRVSAVNAAGTGMPGAAEVATPRTIPGAPTVTSVTGGNRTLTVSFVAPADNGGAAVTTYDYSLDGGATWHRRTTGGATSPLVIGGLVNGVEYQVMIRAVNEAGPGTASATFSGTPQLQLILAPGVPSPVAPSPVPGTSVLVVDGAFRPVTVSTSGGAFNLVGEGFTMQVRGVHADGSLLGLDAWGRIVIGTTGLLQVSGTGYAPGTAIDVWLVDGSILLGQVTVGADGAFTQRFDVPDDIAIGAHTVQVNGVSVTGEVRSLSTGFLVLADAAVTTPAAAPLAATGTDLGSMLLMVTLLLAAGAVTLAASRIRRFRSLD